MAAKAKGGVSTAPETVVTLGGTKYTLKPTINSVRAINSTLGGLRPALDAVQALNFDATATIIAAASGTEMKAKTLRAMGDALWQAGDDRAAILGDVTEFLIVLLNGGKKVDDDETDSKGDDEGNE